MARQVEARDGAARRRLRLAPLALLLAVTPGAAAIAQPAGPAAAIQPAGVGELRRNMVSVDGQDRAYFYYAPASVDRAGFNPVVYALHDDGQTAAEFAEQ